MLEFVLAGIPMMFVLISMFELSRGLWAYHSVGYSVREGVRYATFHGKGCLSPNTCSVTIGQISSVIKSAGSGLDPAAVTVQFTSAVGAVSSNTLANQLASTTVWPPAGSNSPGQNVKISMKYPFRSFLGVLWSGSSSNQIIYLPASSTEPIQY